MKKLLLLFILTPIISLAQVDTDAYKIESPYSTEKKNTEVKQEVNISNQKSAAEIAIERQRAQAEIAAAMAAPSIETIVPLNIDLNNYTHIALVSLFNSDRKRTYESWEENWLVNSPLSVINPFVYDKKRAKKNYRFLKEIKNPNWLYLYTDYNKINPIDFKRDLLLRDSKNKIVYRVEAINVDISTLLSPLVNF